MLPGQSQDNVRTKIGRPGQYQDRVIFPGQCQDKDNSGQFFRPKSWYIKLLVEQKYLCEIKLKILNLIEADLVIINLYNNRYF